ncbi:3-dehydroquinate dehydratase 2 [Hoeflea sp. EC-HK425]|nr:3-dehydroquinate dehydratase 2 [Hoeflea sp. EC-HK425]
MIAGKACGMSCARARNLHRPVSGHQRKADPVTGTIYVLNGPNLNLLGKRQPEIYGHETLADVEAAALSQAESYGLAVRFLQSNAEHQLIDWIHEAREDAVAVIINPGAYTHTSIAILDALNTFEGPVMEVHISNVHKREEFRRHSYVSLRADGVIAGCGTQGYLLAIDRVAKLVSATN